MGKLGWVWVAGLLLGCATPVQQVQAHFKGRFSCDERVVVAAVEANRHYEATGCGVVARYSCGSSCELDEVDEEERRTRVAQRVRTEPLTEVPRSKPRRKVRVLELQLSLTSDSGPGLLTLIASPQESEDVAALLWRHGTDCPLEMMVDGQRLKLPAHPSEPMAVVLSRGFVRDLGVAQQMSVRHCERRWSLGARDLSDLHQFVARYEEELAWNDEPRNSPSGGRKPPLGGWKPWRALKERPRAQVAAAALPPTLLFQKLSPSVLRLEATLADGVAQGSAVAVSPSLVATNCHVVEGASKIAVKQGNATYSAVLAQSDPASDRCVLEVTPATLTPIAGVRDYADLKVGEPLFTLGNPSGLDLSLADGMLSGLRSDEGQRYVQTTAPISPGSSGGGLFDAQGNLVGITTMVLIGKENHNQALNFAIAAEAFWQP